MISVYSWAIHQLLCFRLNVNARQTHDAIFIAIGAATVNAVLLLHLSGFSKIAGVEPFLLSNGYIFLQQKTIYHFFPEFSYRMSDIAEFFFLRRLSTRHSTDWNRNSQKHSHTDFRDSRHDFKILCTWTNFVIFAVAAIAGKIYIVIYSYETNYFNEMLSSFCLRMIASIKILHVYAPKINWNADVGKLLWLNICSNVTLNYYVAYLYCSVFYAIYCFVL